MNIWLLIDGKKSGPHHDYEVRSMINNKDLEPDVLAWHERMADWSPVGEMPLFEESFAQHQISSEQDEDFNLEADSQAQSEQIDPSNMKSHSEILEHDSEVKARPKTYTAEGEAVETLYDGKMGVFFWRRGCARIVDIFFLIAISMLTIILFWRENPFLFLPTEQGQIFILVLFITYDTILIHLCGTSLGKALLGIRIENISGHNLPFFSSLIRGTVVSLIIMAALQILLGALLLIICMIFAKYRKRLPWDLYASSAARGLALTSGRVFTTIFVLITMNLVVSLITPAKIKQEQQQIMRENWATLIKQLKEH